MYGSRFSRWNREVVFFSPQTSHITDEPAVPFIHICFNFCKAGSEKKVQLFLFFKVLEQDIWFLVGQQC